MRQSKPSQFCQDFTKSSKQNYTVRKKTMGTITFLLATIFVINVRMFKSIRIETSSFFSVQGISTEVIPADQLYPNFDLLKETFCPSAPRGKSNLQCIIDNIYQTDHVSTYCHVHFRKLSTLNFGRYSNSTYAK